MPEAIRYLAIAASIIKDNREALHSLLTVAEKAKSELIEFMSSPDGEHLLLSDSYLASLLIIGETPVLSNRRKWR